VESIKGGLDQHLWSALWWAVPKTLPLYLNKSSDLRDVALRSNQGLKKLFSKNAQLNSNYHPAYLNPIIWGASFASIWWPA